MLNKLYFVLAVAGFPLTMSMSSHCIARNDDDIVALIPRDFDGLLSKEEIERRQKLIVLGERAYPALAATLVSTDDESLIRGILGIFAESAGDKSVPRNAIRELIKKWRSGEKEGVNVLSMSCRLLGRIGTKEEGPALLSLLDHYALPVRIQALRALGVVGDKESIPEIRKWVQSRKATEAGRPAPLADPSIAEAEKALDAIERKKGGAVGVR